MLTFLLSFLLGTAAHAQLDFPMPGPRGEQKTSLRVMQSLYGPADLNGDKFRMQQSGLQASVPVWTPEGQSLALSASLKTINVDKEISLPADGVLVPHTLKDINFAGTYTKQLGGEKFWSLSASFGSASDQPFHDASVDTLGANWSYLLSKDELHSWILIVNYSNNRPILNNIPLPGFAYVYTPGKNFRGVFGFPFVFTHWEFVPRWSWNFMVLGFSVVKSEVTYSLWGPFFQAFTYFDFSQQPFRLKDRSDRKQRLFYNEQRWVLGVRAPLHRFLFAELSFGKALGRSFFEAESYEHKDENQRSLGSAGVLQLNLTSRF